jgi:hypothetical protein
MNNDVTKIQTETADIRKRLDKIEQYLRGKLVPDEFVEYRGIFFKKTSDGGYCDAVFCPTCLQVMLNSENGIFICLPCDRRSVNLGHKDIKYVIKEMQGTLSIVK